MPPSKLRASIISRLLTLSAISGVALGASAGAYEREQDFHNGCEALMEGAAADAYEHFLSAAVAGHPVAQNNLAAMYYLGKGVAASVESALFWAKIARKNGLIGATGLAVIAGAKIQDGDEAAIIALATRCLISDHTGRSPGSERPTLH